jgi:hypothetical protein
MGNDENYVREIQSRDAWRRWSYASNQRYNATWQTEIERDPAMSRVRMTFDIVLGDVAISLATDSMSTTSGRDGVVHEYLPGLAEEPELAHSYDSTSMDGTSSARSIGVKLVGKLIDARALIAEGRYLSGHAEVCLQYDGMDYDNRFVLMRGDVTGSVSFGASGETLELEIVDPKESTDLPLPPYHLDDLRSPNADASSMGLRYPLIYGNWDGVPMPWYDTSSGTRDFIAAMGHGWTIGDVMINDINPPNAPFTAPTYTWSTQEIFDNGGAPITVARFAHADAFSDDDPQAVYAQTLTAPSRRPVDLLGVMRDLVETYSILGRSRYNHELHALTVAKVGVKNIRAMINGSSGGAAADVLKYIEGGLLTSFPQVSMVWDGPGYGPVATDRRSSLIVANLVVGQSPLLDRATMVEETAKSNLFNDISLRYNFDPIHNNFTKIITRNPSNSDLCKASRDSFGHRPLNPIESMTIFDDAVAASVVDWIVDHRTLPSFYVEYSCLPFVFFLLRRGDNVHLTDDDFNWDEQVSTIEKLTYSRGLVTMGLRVWWRYYQLGPSAFSV